jgi:type VI secretion system secreted protein VgrG
MALVSVKKHVRRSMSASTGDLQAEIDALWDRVEALTALLTATDGSLAVRAADAVRVTSGKTLVLEAGDKITISTGDASIVMKKDGTVTIKGRDVTIDSSGKINVKASADVVVKGGKILQN